MFLSLQAANIAGWHDFCYSSIFSGFTYDKVILYL